MRPKGLPGYREDVVAERFAAGEISTDLCKTFRIGTRTLYKILDQSGVNHVQKTRQTLQVVGKWSRKGWTRCLDCGGCRQHQAHGLCDYCFPRGSYWIGKRRGTRFCTDKTFLGWKWWEVQEFLIDRMLQEGK